MRTRVGIVGCGLMGAGIAEVAARAGHDVVVTELDTTGADRGRRRLESSLRRAEDRGRIGSADAVLQYIEVGDDLDRLADRQIVVEAVAEDENVRARGVRATRRRGGLAACRARLQHLLHPRS